MASDTEPHAPARRGLGPQHHVAITRVVRPGREAEFERQIAEFFAQAARQTETRAYLIRPIDRSSPAEYGVLRVFDSEAQKRAFYESKLYERWSRQVAPLVDGEPVLRELQGLEFFFRHESKAAPPAWKMALVTWFAVNPAVLVASRGFVAAFGEQHWLVQLLAINALVVGLLTWLLMPVLTRALSSWLRPTGAS